MPKRVLVVEDNAILRDIMLRQLNSFGVNCYAVANAEEAVELAEFFDLVLMDIQLPGMSGVEATRVIRQRERDRGLPAVPIVATTCKDNRRECMQAGMDDYCPKPITRDILLGILKSYVFDRPPKLRLLG